MRKIWDFHGGVHPPENKHQSLGRPIRPAGIPPELILPLNQHIGAPAAPVVEVGQKVLKGECIAKPAGFISVPVHAPTSGTVTAIEERLVAHPSGLPAECIVIATDGEDRWVEHAGIADPSAADKATLLACIRDAGIAGMGGAGFPTSVKLGVNPKSGGIDTLILNGTECEPYITADHALMRERAEDIVAGTRILQQLVEPRETLLGVEDNKPDAIAALRQACEGMDMEVVVFPTKYPSGGEKQLIEILTGRQVPSGGLPADIGVVCQNMGTAVAVYRAVAHGEPLISRITTVTGEAIAQPGNFEVLLGTPMSYLLELSGFSAGRLQRLVMGGPMMGFTVPDPAVPVVKTTNCILAPTEQELPTPPPAQACIRCGMCAEACPVSLLPIERAKAKKAAAQDGEKPQQRPAIAQLDPAELAIERAKAARAANADQSPAEKARANLERMRERLAKSEAKLAASRESGAEANIIEALETAIEKLQPKLADAQRAVDELKAEPVPPAADKDAAQLAIERAQAARAANADQNPAEKARANLERLQERLAKSEAKLAASRESGAEENIIEALEAAIEKLRPKLAAAQRELDELNAGQEA